MIQWQRQGLNILKVFGNQVQKASNLGTKASTAAVTEPKPVNNIDNPPRSAIANDDKQQSQVSKLIATER